MVTVDGALLQANFSDAAISATNAEIVIDAGINLLNVYGAALDNLAGGAGTKSGTYTSAQAGAIMTMAQQIYSKHFKNASQANPQLGGLGLTYSSDTQLLRFARELAFQLKTRSFVTT